MGKQLQLFEKPKEDSKIQQLMESEGYHETGVQLALARGFNKIGVLIELCRYHLGRIDMKAYIERTTVAHDLCEFEFEGCKWFIIDVDSEAFYFQAERGEKVEMSASFYRWKLNDQWGDFDLFNLVARHIKENRQTYDSIIKNK